MQEFQNTLTGKMVTRNAPQESAVEYDGKMMIAEIDLNGIIVYANRKLREMLDYDKEDLIGLPYTISFHPDMPEGVCKQAFDMAKEGKVWGGYAKSITRNGEYFWTAVCVQARYETDQQLLGYIIRKKPADENTILGVDEEFKKLCSLALGSYRSEYCGEMNFH